MKQLHATMRGGATNVWLAVAGMVVVATLAPAALEAQPPRLGDDLLAGLVATDPVLDVPHPFVAPAIRVAQGDAIDPFLQPSLAEPSADDRRMERRRRMLQVHQAIGYSTLTLLTAQVALGWAMYAGYKQNGFDLTFDNMRTAHLALGIAAFTSYWTGASLAIFAPKLEHRHDGYDTIRVHRALAWIHGAGMAIVPVLGYVQSQKRAQWLTDDPSGGKYDRRLLGHQIAGTTAYAALLGAFVTVMLP